MEGQTLFVEILVIFLSWKLFLQIQAQNTFILFIGEIKETRKEIIYSVWPVLFIIIIASRPALLLCQPGRILEQIIFRFCQVFVLPSLSLWLTWIYYRPVLYSVSPDQVFILTNIYFSFIDWESSQPEPGIWLPLLLKVVGPEENQSDQRLIALIILSVERKKLAIWWFLFRVTDFMTEPVTCSGSKRLQFSVSCLLRKYKFYFQLKLPGSGG